MVGFITNPDDNGIRSLIRDNNKDTSTKAVTPTEAALRVRTVGERQPQEEQHREQQQRPQYRGPERRSGQDRRNEHSNIMLDTRTNRERRRTFNPVDTQQDDIPVRGIDIKI